MNDDKNEKRKPNYFFYFILVILIIIAVVTVIVCVNKNHNVGTSNYKDVNESDNHDEEVLQSLEAKQTRNPADLDNHNNPIGEYRNSNSFQKNKPTRTAKKETSTENKPQFNTFKFNIVEFREDIDNYMKDTDFLNEAFNYQAEKNITYEFKSISKVDIKYFTEMNATKERGGIVSLLEKFEHFFLKSNYNKRLFLKSKYTYLGLTMFDRTSYLYFNIDTFENFEENLFQTNIYSCYFEKKNYIISVIFFISENSGLYGMIIIDDLIKK